MSIGIKKPEKVYLVMVVDQDSGRISYMAFSTEAAARDAAEGGYRNSSVSYIGLYKAE